MATEVEVRTKLKLDDEASKNLEKVKSGFDDVEDSAKEAASSVSDFAKNVAAIAVGTYLPNLVRGAVDLATNWFKTANAAHESQKALAGMLMVSQKLDFKTAHRGAEAFHREVLEASIDIGQSVDEMQAGFKDLVKSFGATESQMQSNLGLIKQTSAVANAWGMNAGVVTEEFIAIAKHGKISNSQFGSLVMQTGVFGKDITKVAEAMMRISPAKRFQLAAHALGLVTKQAAKAEPTFRDLATSASNAIVLFKEIIGAPVVKTILPVMKEWIERMKAAKPAIERLAKTLGKDMARWVKEAAEKVEKGFKYLETHGEEIKRDLKEAAAAVKEAFQTAYDAAKFIIKHKEAFFAMYAAAKIGPAVPGAIRGARAVPAMLGGAKGTLAFTAAVVGFGLAVDQFAQAQKEGAGVAEEQKDLTAKMARLAEIRERAKAGAGAWGGVRALTPSQRKEFETLKRESIELATELGQSSAAVGQAYESVWAMRKKTRDITVQLEKVVGAFDTMAEMRFMPHAEQLATQQKLVNQLSVVYMHAYKTQNVGLMKQVAVLLEGSKKAQEAFFTSSKMTAEGYRSLADKLTSEATDFRDMLKHLAGLAAPPPKPGKKPVAPGALTLNVDKMVIRQEFRDQDPDRVVMAFKRDIIRAATRRIQSRRATIFGF